MKFISLNYSRSSFLFVHRFSEKYFFFENILLGGPLLWKIFFFLKIFSWVEAVVLNFISDPEIKFIFLSYSRASILSFFLYHSLKTFHEWNIFLNGSCGAEHYFAMEIKFIFLSYWRSSFFWKYFMSEVFPGWKLWCWNLFRSGNKIHISQFFKILVFSFGNLSFWIVVPKKETCSCSSKLL